jgi:GTP-binding protein
MFDLVKLKLFAGDGGNGRISFRREKFIPKGGPDGGFGGDGGSIYIKGSRHINTLQHFSGVKEFVAQRGEDGGKQKSEGHRGEDIVLEVPLGTVVWLLAENRNSRIRREHIPREGSMTPQIYQEKMISPKMGGKPEPREADKVVPIRPGSPASSAMRKSGTENAAAQLEAENTLPEEIPQEEEPVILRTHSLKNIDLKEVEKIQLLEITDEEPILLCKGGQAGRGNEAFKGSTNTTPLLSEYGSYGEKKIVLFELRLLADIGLIGYPNAGKSTLLSVMTKANPKIANYPFTTLEPNLGVMSLRQSNDAQQSRDLVLADIPGLIEGASQGKGLGYTFLRHVYASKALLYVLTLEESVIFDESIAQKDKAEMLFQQYQILKQELQTYDETLLKKSSVLSLSKKDLYSAELLATILEYFQSKNEPILAFSVLAQQGLDDLRYQLEKVA